MVLIEGSASPSTVLARGARRVVPLTRRVQRLIDRGYVIVVARQTIQLGRRAVDHG